MRKFRDNGWGKNLIRKTNCRREIKEKSNSEVRKSDKTTNERGKL